VWAGLIICFLAEHVWAGLIICFLAEHVWAGLIIWKHSTNVQKTDLVTLHYTVLLATGHSFGLNF
jgi:hypothetical protein